LIGEQINYIVSFVHLSVVWSELHASSMHGGR
jgi:hypothetical protein